MEIITVKVTRSRGTGSSILYCIPLCRSMLPKEIALLVDSSTVGSWGAGKYKEIAYRSEIGKWIGF